MGMLPPEGIQHIRKVAATCRNDNLGLLFLLLFRQIYG